MSQSVRLSASMWNINIGQVTIKSIMIEMICLASNGKDITNVLNSLDVQLRVIDFPKSKELGKFIPVDATSGENNIRHPIISLTLSKSPDIYINLKLTCDSIFVFQLLRISSIVQLPILNDLK